MGGSETECGAFSARIFVGFPLAHIGQCVHNVYVRVIGKPILKSFWITCPQAKNSLMRWLDVSSAARWRSFADIRKTFGAADLYHNKGLSHVVFNIGGNKFRVTAGVQYVRKNTEGVIVVNLVETHSDYDRSNKGRRGKK